MKAARLVAFRAPLQIEDLPVPTPTGDEALVRVTAVGVCRSDWHQWNGDWGWIGAQPRLPITPGHEIGGVIEAVGPAVRALRPGQRVTVPFQQSCGACANCTSGRDNLCLRPEFSGFSRDGGFAEYLIVRVADLNCIPLPDAVSDEVAAALGCRFTTGYHAIAHRARPAAGDWIAIFGAGGVGLSAIQVAAALGARPIAIDLDPAKLAFAKRMGAVETLLASDGNPSKRIREITGGGAPFTVDAIATAKTTQQAIGALCRGGRHVQVGLTSQEDQGQIPFPADILVNAELEIVGSGSSPHAGYAEIFALIAQGRLDPGALITRHIGLGEITDVFHAFDTYATSGLDVVTSFN
ncbi:MAG: alcohol dehydrogenase catalytic domain-containing protein [Vulcanimicrobiaceae bacterium]|jgi:propanol-preferring alcohol dehydrogenase